MALNNNKKIQISVLVVVFLIIGLITYQISKTHYNDPIVKKQFTNLSSLKFVAVLFRHGDRAPIFKYKTDPFKYAFPEGRGELTKKGKQHMYKKGQIFRSIYNYGFLSNMYLDSEILIKTTHIGRTYMSAAMVLAGMYPPSSYQKWSDSETVWQPIPIYSDSPDYTQLIDKRGICELIDSIVEKLFSQFISNSDKNITEPLLTYLSEKCGQPIIGLDIKKFYDLLVCQESNGLSLPEWITPNHFETIKSIVLKKENVDNFFGNPILQKLFVGPMLKEIGLTMGLHLNNSYYNTTRKMHLYSGHDITISMVTGFLGNIKLPDFGASLHFHLYLDKKIGYIIKVFYYKRWDDEEEEEIFIPKCGNPCKIDNFIKLVENNFSGEWKEECQKLES